MNDRNRLSAAPSNAASVDGIVSHADDKRTSLPPWDDARTCSECGGYAPRDVCLMCGVPAGPRLLVQMQDGTQIALTLRELLEAAR